MLSADIRNAGIVSNAGTVRDDTGTAAATQRPSGSDGPDGAARPAWWSRLAKRLGRYALVLLTCLAIVATLVVLTPRRHHDSTPTVDYGADLAGLRRQAPYTVYAPQGLPTTWRPTGSRLTGSRGAGPVSWHLSFATPSDRHGALEESDERPDGPGGFVIRMTSEGQPDGSQPVAGAVWQRYVRTEKDQRSLVRRLPGVTLVVTGTASYAELGVLAAALRPTAPVTNR